MEIYFVKLVFDKIQIRILLSKRHIFLFQFVQSLKADNIIGGGIQVSNSGVTRIGTTGLFTAIVIGWATVQIYRFTVKHNWQIKMPDVVPAGVSNSFSSLIPGFCVAFVVATINLILVLMGTDIFKVMYVPFSFVGNIAGTWWGLLIIVFFIHFLWWFGIHGANIMSSFYTPIALASLAANVKGAHNFFAGDPMNAIHWCANGFCHRSLHFPRDRFYARY